MPAPIDLAGHTYERLRVEAFADSDAGGRRAWLCLCDPELGGCGRRVKVRGNSLRTDNTVSCGCHRRQQAEATIAAVNAAAAGVCPVCRAGFVGRAGQSHCSRRCAAVAYDQRRQAGRRRPRDSAPPV